MIQYESRSLELAFIYAAESNPEVLAYFDQPVRLKMERPCASTGRNVGFYSAPDFCLISESFIGFVEVKGKAELAILSAKNPDQFLFEDGKWTCPPGERAAKDMGFSYRVFCEDDFGALLLRNIDFLNDYFKANALPVQERLSKIQEVAAKHTGHSISEILASGEVTNDELYACIAHQVLYTDLDRELVPTGAARIYPDHVAFLVRRPCARPSHTNSTPVRIAPQVEIVWSGTPYKIAYLDAESVALLGPEGTKLDVARTLIETEIAEGRIVASTIPDSPDKALEALAVLSPEQIRTATYRYNVIHGICTTTACARTVRDWRTRFRAGIEKYGRGGGLVGLAPETASGNDAPKLADTTTMAMSEFITHDYASIRAESVAASYRSLCTKLADQGVISPSIKSFRRAIKKFDQVYLSRRRQGSRAAYQVELPCWDLGTAGPRHGDYPWAIAHIDHTQIDLVTQADGTPLGKAWLTIMVLAYSRRVVAFHLSYRSPSAHAVLAVLRHCIFKHHRLPSILVVDNGAEFHSVDFETFAAVMEIQIRRRPPHHARHGCIVETLFRKTTAEILHSLAGNTKIMKNVRQVTKSVSPARNACWTLPTLYALLAEYFFSVYDTTSHATLHASPREVHEAGMLKGGVRPHAVIPYSEELKILTLPTISRRFATVGRHGVQVRNWRYWHPIFRKHQDKRVAVRYDPLRISEVYAFVAGQWHQCRCNHHFDFDACSWDEIAVATEILRQQRAIRRSKECRPSPQFSMLLRSLRETEISLQRLRDREDREVSRLIEETGSVLPKPEQIVTPPPSLADDSSAVETESNSEGFFASRDRKRLRRL